MVAEPTAPAMEEPSTTGPISPGGGLHDEGDPGVEELSGGLGGEGMETTGDASSSTTLGLPMVAEQAPSAVPPTVGEVLGRFGQARRQPRRAPLLAAPVEIKAIVWEPTPPPQLLRTVIQRGEEFEMLEEVEASAETKMLRADLSSMIGRIEVRLKRSSLYFK